MRFSKETFIDPGNSYAAAFAWAWNTTITKEGIREQLTQMQQAGIRAVYVIPEPKEFRPGSMATDMQPKYMSEEYLELVKYYYETAKELGFAVWLYDEGGWPSGSVCTQINQIRPDLKRKHIKCIDVIRPIGARYTPPVTHKNYLASFLRTDDGTYTRLTDPIIYDGNGKILEYRCMDVFYANPNIDEYNTDILHPDTVQLFLRMTHEKYKGILGDAFGRDIPYIFVDEPSVEPDAWTPGLQNLFAEKYGYDILDYLPVLTMQIPAATLQQQTALADWRRLICRLAIDNFFLPIQNWCHENGLLATGHLNGDHDANRLATLYPCNAMPLEVYRSFDVPGVDAIWRHIFPEGAGLPSFEKACPFYPRYVSSAAAQTGRGLALTESMPVYGEGATPSIVRYVFGAQAIRGINVFNVNSINYERSPIRPLYAPQKPGYTHLRALNAFLTRLCYLSQLGTPECDTALYMPCYDIAAGRGAESFNEAGLRLEKSHVYFDLIDDAFVRGAVEKDGALTMGLAAYRNIIIPEGATLPEDVRQKLTPYCHNAATPVAECSNPHLRMIKRNPEDGSALYLVFNEHKDSQSARIVFPDSRPCFRLNLETGAVTRCDDFTLTLAMGEVAAYFFTDSAVDAAPAQNPRMQTAVEAPYSLRKTKEFFVTPAGISLDSVQEPAQPVLLGSWSPVLSESFSGEAVYRTTLHLEPDFLAGSEYELDLGKVEYTADVTVNGVPVGIAAFLPHKVRFGAGVLKEENTIEITVANTACNRIISADVYSYFTEKQIGPYHEKEVAYESETLGGGLYGPVILKKLG